MGKVPEGIRACAAAMIAAEATPRRFAQVLAATPERPDENVVPTIHAPRPMPVVFWRTPPFGVYMPIPAPPAE